MIIKSKTIAFVIPKGGDSERILIPTELRYDTERPAEVVFAFDNEGDIVEWSMSRALLQEGTLRTAGEGDIMFTPSTKEGLILGHLESPDGELDFEMSEPDLLSFLNETFSRVSYVDEEKVISDAFDSWFSAEFGMDES